MLPDQFVGISVRRIGRKIKQPQRGAEACDERLGLLRAMRRAAIDDEKDRLPGACDCPRRYFDIAKAGIVIAVIALAYVLSSF